MTTRQRQDAHHQEVVRAYYQTGDEAPLGPLLTELRPRLLALARGTFGVRDQERAEDLVQDTLAALLQALRAQQYAGTGTVAAYASTHLRFVFLTSRRYRPGDPGAEEDPYRTIGNWLKSELVTDGEQTEQEGQAARTIAAATQAVLSLDPNARAAVVLHYYQGLSILEAAGRLDIDVETFRTRLRRGLGALREWATTTTRPTAEVYAALPRLDTGNLFTEPLRLAG